ncbi:MAG: glycoside hydrolase [Desulfobacteraceae bacterium]|nr:MAG: glycoside hydrolase [Desulfobacteraceae bacterium]
MKTKTVGENKYLAASTQPGAENASSQIKKVFFKSKNRCRVTFRVPKEVAAGAKKVCLVGDFNSWDAVAHPLKMFKNGSFSITLDLEPGREYQYRFLIDDTRWENDAFADKYNPSPYAGIDNSVIIL